MESRRCSGIEDKKLNGMESNKKIRGKYGK